MLVELGVVEQRSRAVLEVLEEGEHVPVDGIIPAELTSRRPGWPPGAC